MADDAQALRPASTILMCRDSAEGIETFMVVRHHQIDFASGALVFPGGKVDLADSDSALHERCRGIETVKKDLIPFQVAAIREAFEESGILFARELGSSALIPADRLSTLEHYRDPLNRGEISMLDFLVKEGLDLACDCLHRYAHWITPEFMPKRFDTHFFIARAPEDHLGAHDGSESVDSVWISPTRLQRESEEGKWTVIFPTRCNIELLDLSAAVDEAIEHRRANDIVTVMPWVEQRDEGTFLCIPPEAGYPNSSELAQRSSA